MQHRKWKRAISLGVVLLLSVWSLSATEPVEIQIVEEIQSVDIQIVKEIDSADMQFVKVMDFDEELQDWEAYLRDQMVQALATLWSGPSEERLDVLWEAEFLFEPFREMEEEDAEPVIASLMQLFAVERDEWTLDRLALGLAGVRAESLNPLFEKLLSHPSPNVRWRAIYHFGKTEGPETVPALRRLIHTETRPWVRMHLLEAVDIQEGRFLEQCLPWVYSNDLSLAVETIDFLDREVERALPVLLERAIGGQPPVRAAAVRRLAAWADSRKALETVIEITRSSDLKLQRIATQVLGFFPHEDARSRLEEIAHSRQMHRCPRAAAAAALMTPETTDEVVKRWSNPGRACNRIPRWVWSGYVTPPATMDSIRCWRGPDIVGDPEHHPRIPANTRIQIRDRFEAGGTQWVEVLQRGCWIPRDHVAEGRPERRPQDAAEMDITVEGLDTTMVVRLIHADRLELVDWHPPVTGLKLVIDPGLAEDVELLLEVYETGESALHAAVLAALEQSIELGALDDDLLDRARVRLEVEKAAVIKVQP